MSHPGSVVQPRCADQALSGAARDISGETYFFRDHGQFELLRHRILPALIEQRRNVKTLRLWSAGCATGEEAYSLAMLLDLLLPEHEDWRILLLGTDVNRQALDKAREGYFGSWSFRTMPAEFWQRCFQAEGQGWRLNDRIRRMVSFDAQDLIQDDYPDARTQNMDLIICRNVFIYFAFDAVNAAARKLSTCLAEGGYLLVGHTELMGHSVTGLCARMFTQGMVYQKRAAHAVSPVPVRELPVEPLSLAKPVHPPQFTRRAPAALATALNPPPSQKPRPTVRPAPGDWLALYRSARDSADRGDYALADQNCSLASAAAPLAADPYFLKAQLAQVRGDFGAAKTLLNQALYLDHGHIAAHLELAALHERDGQPERALALRQAALTALRALPVDQLVEPYDVSAAELTQTLVAWVSKPSQAS